MNFFPTHIHTKFSILDGIIKFPELIERCKELGYKSCCITDHGNIGGAFQFIEEMNKNDIKPIIGIEFYVRSNSSTESKDMVLLAKNKSGYFELVKMVSKANKQNSYLKLDQMEGHGKDLIALTGHPGSLVGDILCKKGVLRNENNPLAIDEDLMRQAEQELLKIKEIFFDVYLEIQLFNSEASPGLVTLAKALRELGKRTNTKCIACIDAHYARKEDAEIQRIAICSSMKTTLKEGLATALVSQSNKKNFFLSDKFYIPSIEELLEFGNTQEEIDNVKEIDSLCESYSLSHAPRLPKFSDRDDYQLLVELARKGWKKRITNTWDQELYGERVKKELKVIKRTNLSAYFLIVADYINYMKEKGWLIGPGRGSSGGSLVCYLLGITEVDSIKNGLIFERFFNPGRCYTKHVSFDEFRYLEDFYE